MRKVSKILTILAICVIVIVLATVIWMVLFPSMNYPRDVLVIYDIHVSAGADTEYTIFVPLIVNSNGTISNVMSSVTLKEGVANWNLEDSLYGKVMNLTAKGTIWLRASSRQTVDGDIYMNTSRHPYGLPDFNLWVDNASTDSASAEIRFFLNFTNDVGPVHIELNLQLDYIHHVVSLDASQGWQTAEARVEAIVP